MKRNKFVITFETSYVGDEVTSEAIARGIQHTLDQLDNEPAWRRYDYESQVIKVTNSLTGDSYVAPKAGEVAS